MKEKENKSGLKNITIEHKRLMEDKETQFHWKKWGPYLSERQWGTVREDYSENGDAWKAAEFNEVDD